LGAFDIVFTVYQKVSVEFVKCDSVDFRFSCKGTNLLWKGIFIYLVVAKR